MNISQRLDALPMTPMMWKVLVITGIGWMFDAMDQGMVSGVIASIGLDWSLTTAQAGFLGSAGVLGMIVGAVVSGIAADRFGRRTVIVTTLLIFSVGSLLCGLAQSYEMLLLFRFVTGLGLGGELPVASTLVSEFSPLRSRGRNVVILESFWAWGWIIAALVAYLAIPIFGWRIAFFVGAVPALFAAVLRFAVPESPRYLDLKGKHAEADALVCAMEEQAHIKELKQGTLTVKAEAKAANANTTETESVTPQAKSSFVTLWKKEHIRSTLVLWVLWFGINLGYYGFVLWTPSLLVNQGYDLVKSFEFTLIMCIAQLPGYFIAAILIEKIGRKPVLTVFLLGTAIAAWFFGHAGDTTQVLASGCMLYFFALGAWGCVYSYTPELYPTSIRGIGTGWAAAFGRIGAFLAPMIVPVLYSFFGAENGFVFVFGFLTAVFVVIALVVGIFGIETKNVSLEG